MHAAGTWITTLLQKKRKQKSVKTPSYRLQYKTAGMVIIYIGGTKVGAFIWQKPRGLLFPNQGIFCSSFFLRVIKKQHGRPSWLINGRILWHLNLNTLFTNDLYYKIPFHGNGNRPMLLFSLKN